MTYKEIIKDLKSLFIKDDEPCFKGFGSVIQKYLLKETIDLLEQQQQEIKKLKKEAKSTKIKAYKRFAKEVNNDLYFCLHCYTLDNIYKLADEDGLTDKILKRLMKGK